jgi:exopolysaccharide production protein ExoZ
MHLFEHGALGVDLFFVISGVVIASVTTGRFGRPRNAGIFLYHRLARIFPIFWIYTTISLIAHSFNRSGRNGDDVHSYNLLASYLLIPTRLPMLLLQGWTLSYELYFYLVFFLLLLFMPERIAPWLLGLWGIAIIVTKLHIGLSASSLIQILTNPLALEFLVGCIIFHIYRRSRLHPSAGTILLLTSLLWLVAIIAYTALTHPGHPEWIADGPWRRPLLYGTFSALFLLGAIELERTRIIRYLPILSSIGDWSYSIYLSHTLVLRPLAWLIARLMPNHASIFLITLIGLPAVTLVGYLSYTYLERPLLTLFYKPTIQPQIPAKQPV